MNHARRRSCALGIAITVVLATACGGHTSKASPPLSAGSTPSTAVSSPASSAASSSIPPSPSVTIQASPTVPADVPTTGPNLLHVGEAPPVMPTLATMDSTAGAVAFAKFFIQTLDWGYATTSSTYVRHYYEATCEFCTAEASAIDEAASKHHRYIGDRFLNLVTAQQPVAGKAADFAVRVTFDVTGVEVADSDGNPVDASPPHPGYAEDLYLVRRTDHWVVVEMTPRP